MKIDVTSECASSCETLRGLVTDDSGFVERSLYVTYGDLERQAAQTFCDRADQDSTSSVLPKEANIVCRGLQANGVCGIVAKFHTRGSNQEN